MKRLALVIALVVAQRAASAQPSPDDELTTDQWQPARTFDLHWRLLELPAHALELGLLPLRLAIEATEAHRIDRRIADLFDIWGGRIKFSPRFKFSFGDGAGIGAKVKLAKLADERAEVSLGGLYRINRDWLTDFHYEHNLLLPGGRGLRMYAFAERDKNRRFYGLGNATLDTDRRALAADDEAIVAETDLQGIDRYTYYGTLAVGLRHQKLFAGEDAGELPVMVGDTVAPPSGFDESAVYTDVKVVGRFDTRDTSARPTRGWLIELGALARGEVTGMDLSAVTFTGNARVHLPIIAEGRTLAFTVGGIAAMPLYPGSEIPLDSQAVLGRTFVRGYDRDRFRDRYALYASAEYRFPIYEYLASKAGLDAFLFFDTGVAFGEQSLSLDPLHYSYGGGIRAAHETTLVFQTILGVSPEGFELTIGVEKYL